MEPEPVELRRVRGRDPLRHGRRPGGFKTVWLNLAGWSVLLGVGVVAGGVAAFAGAPALLALPAGVVATWLLALVADHLRWRDMRTGMGRSGLDSENGPRIVARLRAMGIDAVYEETVVDGEEPGTTDVQRSIGCRNADRDAVAEVMREELAP